MVNKWIRCVKQAVTVLQEQEESDAFNVSKRNDSSKGVYWQGRGVK